MREWENGEGYMAWHGVRRTVVTLIAITDTNTYTALLEASHDVNLIQHYTLSTLSCHCETLCIY